MILIHNATIVNEGILTVLASDRGRKHTKIFIDKVPNMCLIAAIKSLRPMTCISFSGVIDDQVHFVIRD
jgi:hypothetical protein